MKSIYINTAAVDPSAAFVRSQTTPTPTPLPQFRLGDLEQVQLYLVDGEGSFDSESGNGALTVKFALGNKAAEPTGGTYKLTDGTDTTTALAYNANASTVQTALNALNSDAGPFSDTVTVEGTWPSFKVTWDGTGAHAMLAVADNELEPNAGVAFAELTAGDGSTAEVQSIYLAQSPVVFKETWSTITNGWQSQVSFATYELRDFLAGEETADIWLEVEITDTSGNRVTRLQGKTVVHGEVIADDALAPVDLPSYYTKTESDAAYVHNKSLVTGLTGGGSTNLDGIETASIATGIKVAIDVSNELYVYELESGTDAESSPEIIRPNDYAASTNEKIWKLKTVFNPSHSSEQITITGAGNTNITPALGVRCHTAFVEIDDTGANYATGDFTASLSLVSTNSLDGDVVKVRIQSSLPMDETVTVYDASTGGTLLTTFPKVDGGTGNYYRWAEYVYDETDGEFREIHKSDAYPDNELPLIPVASSSSIAIDFDAGQYQTLTLADNTTFTASNQPSSANFCKAVTLKITTDGSARTVAFPSWTWLNTAPSSLSANTTSILSLTAYGTTAASVIAVLVTEV
jgi:hypothetical protein